MTSQSKLVNVARQHDTLTANEAVTHSTSLNACSDFFFVAGASRTMSKNDIITAWVNAFTEDQHTAILLLFWLRDIRGGAGERRAFRIIWQHMLENYGDYARTLEPLILEYGRADDLWTETFRGHTLKLIKDELNNGNGLVAKWMPRKGRIFNELRSLLNWTPKMLRKRLVELTNVVESKMCANQWATIEYSHVPSVAAKNYAQAFETHDPTRYREYIDKVMTGENKINASAIFPYDVLRGSNEHTVLAQWESLPNYMEGSTERVLPMVDVSGSMITPISEGLTALLVAVSLGLYISERNESIFKDAFITFSLRPEMNYLKGNVIQRMEQMKQNGWGFNTNLQRAFDLILNKANKHSLTPEEMPTKILILSDMEFDMADRGDTNFEVIDKKFAMDDYKRPDIIFWNLNGRLGNVPVRFDENGTALISGFSPAILTSLLGGEDMTPQAVMRKTVDSPRYDAVRKKLEEF